MAEEETSMWRDPMDDLIEQLEAAVPAKREFALDLAPLEELQEAVCLTLYGSAKDQARVHTDPRFARLRAYLARQEAKGKAASLEKSRKDQS
jgi:hypothetical protein